MERQMQIGEAARRLGVNPKTIRYYEGIGLVPKARRSRAGYRLYDRHDLDRIEFVLRARALGFSLEDIAEILAFRERGEAPCSYVGGLAAQRIAAVEAQITALLRLRQDLEGIARWAGPAPQPARAADQTCICHLIEKSESMAAARSG